MNLFRRRETQEGFTRKFPKERMGRVHYDKSKCIRAYECVKYCPAQAIRIGKDKFIEIDHEKCIRCGVCTLVCPSKALTMRKK